MRILAISGSLRQDSFNTRLLRALPPLAPEGMDIELFDGLGEVPLYDQDLDVVDCPKPVHRLRTAIAEADGLIIASPEYNGSIPGVLKNAIDWASRPMARSALLAKCVVTMVATPGPGLGRNALSDLGRVLRDCHAFVISGPWVHLTEAPAKMEDVVAEGGEVTTVLTDPRTRRLVDIQLTSLQQAVKEEAGRHAVAPLLSFLQPRQ
ncbi:NADPH-dependent FMN reductase [Streptomyces sp. NPDC057456]|uniref:NADPH-dependent FMN reductase n=1 Tax=unclassified Streptomyces TaxID=2593676 RepID=UPI0033A200AA